MRSPSISEHVRRRSVRYKFFNIPYDIYFIRKAVKFQKMSETFVTRYRYIRETNFREMLKYFFLKWSKLWKSCNESVAKFFNGRSLKDHE